MPRRCVVAREAQWVPLIVRSACYGCGEGILKIEEKDNCRVCADVFCLRCLQQRMVLPSMYGYIEAQPICGTCAYLHQGFVAFSRRLEAGEGGMLLRPHGAVVVESWALASKAALPSNGHKPPSSHTYCLRQPVDEAPTPLSLVGWRPINPHTSIRAGEVSIALTDVAAVGYLTEGGVVRDGRRHNAVGNGRIRIDLRTGIACVMIVGTLEDDGARGFAFVIDADMARTAALAIAQLIGLCSRHAAFEDLRGTVRMAEDVDAFLRGLVAGSIEAVGTTETSPVLVILGEKPVGAASLCLTTGAERVTKVMAPAIGDGSPQRYCYTVGSHVVLYPTRFCSCRAYQFQVMRGTAPFCKHFAAVMLALTRKATLHEATVTAEAFVRLLST